MVPPWEVQEEGGRGGGRGRGTGGSRETGTSLHATVLQKYDIIEVGGQITLWNCYTCSRRYVQTDITNTCKFVIE